MNGVWNRVLGFHEVSRGPVRLHLEAGEGDRSGIAKRLGLVRLTSFSAEIVAKSWLDGVELTGRFQAVVEQTCGVSLEVFEQSVSGDLDVRVLPAGSAHAPAAHTGDAEFDAEALDAPDVLDGDTVDVTEYLVEHLSLELDPFPRKPGATFAYAAAPEDTSPFGALRKLGEPKA